MSSVIKKCNCVNEFQDKQYGAGMRVHTVSGKVRTDGLKYSCTVCGSRKK